MNSIFAQLFLDIQQRIAAECPDIKWIDQDLGQDQSDIRPPVTYPAVLIDFPQADFDSLGGTAQSAEFTVQLKLLLDSWASASSVSPNREEALQAYELEEKLISALHGWRTDYCRKLIRSSVASENRNDINLRIRTITFTTAAEFYPPAPDTATASAQPEISIG
jgi:hypothetical protein